MKLLTEGDEKFVSTNLNALPGKQLAKLGKRSSKFASYPSVEYASRSPSYKRIIVTWF